MKPEEAGKGGEEGLTFEPSLLFPQISLVDVIMPAQGRACPVRARFVSKGRLGRGRQKTARRTAVDKDGGQLVPRLALESTLVPRLAHLALELEYTVRKRSDLVLEVLHFLLRVFEQSFREEFPQSDAAWPRFLRRRRRHQLVLVRCARRRRQRVCEVFGMGEGGTDERGRSRGLREVGQHSRNVMTEKVARDSQCSV